MATETHGISIRTFFPNGNKCDHRQDMKLSEIKKWVEAYFYTHPDCEAITIKIWRES